MLLSAALKANAYFALYKARVNECYLGIVFPLLFKAILGLEKGMGNLLNSCWLLAKSWLIGSTHLAESSNMPARNQQAGGLQSGRKQPENYKKVAIIN